MSKFLNFIFKDYNFNPKSGVLDLYYSLDGEVEFHESYKFDFEFAAYDEGILDRAIQSLFFMAGVSYYKTYIPPNIVVDKGDITPDAAEFYAKTYQKGLGEFFYVNKLDPKTEISFPVTTQTLSELDDWQLDGDLMVGIGGGKDSLVSVEFLKKLPLNTHTWSLSHRKQLEPLVKEIDLRHYWVDRQWDKKLLELNKQGALNGHVPISAIIACVGTVVAVLSGHRQMVVSNEKSASEPTLEYNGEMINHQYSKSIEFEKCYQSFLAQTIGGKVEYYSFLRPLSEIRIAEIFSIEAFQKYRDVFSSCNHAFTHQSQGMFWCGACPKCAFTYLVLSPFIKEKLLMKIWGKNLLKDKNLKQTYRELLGISGNKPLDCVGEVKESRTAMLMAQGLYPELKEYSFEIPEDYEYKAMGADRMPTEMRAYLEDLISKTGV